jgi:hypothetical protein
MIRTGWFSTRPTLGCNGNESYDWLGGGRSMASRGKQEQRRLVLRLLVLLPISSLCVHLSVASQQGTYWHILVGRQAFRRWGGWHCPSVCPLDTSSTCANFLPSSQSMDVSSELRKETSQRKVHATELEECDHTVQLI